MSDFTRTLSKKEIFLAMIITISFIYFKSSDSNSPPENNIENRKLAWIETGKDLVRSKLKDPSSAEFKNVYFNKNPTPVSCGEVNGKNSFGAYSGFQHFISAGTIEMTFLENDVEDFYNVWNQFCVNEISKPVEPIKKVEQLNPELTPQQKREIESKKCVELKPDSEVAKCLNKLYAPK